MAARPRPRSYLERFEWIEVRWDLHSSAMRDRLVRKIARLRSSTGMSGMGCAEILIYLIWWCCNSKCGGGVPFPVCVSSCGKTICCRVTLCSFIAEDAVGLGCMFDLLGLLPPDLQTEIEPHMPFKG